MEGGRVTMEHIIKTLDKVSRELEDKHYEMYEVYSGRQLADLEEARDLIDQAITVLEGL